MALNATDSIKTKVGDFQQIIDDAEAKLSGGLFEAISKELVGPNNPIVGDLSKVLKGLQVIGKLKLPAGPTTGSQLTAQHALLAKQVLHEILVVHGQPGLSIASDLAMDLVMKSAHTECGAGKTVDASGQSVAQTINGPDISRDTSDRDLIFYYIEEDDDGVPKLPPINGSPKLARSSLRRAFTRWARSLMISTVPVANQNEAHLLITGASYSDPTLLARTDIGPPRGQQLRMVFNLNKTDFTEERFIANVSHEFGHALGISHRDVDQSDESLVMHGTNLGVGDPTDTDIAAAVSKGWRAVT